jgi:hypothetical protein
MTSQLKIAIKVKQRVWTRAVFWCVSKAPWLLLVISPERLVALVVKHGMTFTVEKL